MTVWDQVNDDMDLVPKDVVEARFAKKAAATTGKEKKKEEGASDKPAMKSLRIITDPSLVVGKEAALKSLPPAHEVARAIVELDTQVLDLENLRSVMDAGCPSPEQICELQKLKQEYPNVPLALPEQYMWIISQIPAYQMRLDCWAFVRTYGDRQYLYAESLKRFKGVVECFKRSESLPALLGLVLAVGNYLNGGSERGQADGFDLETLGKLNAVKDAEGKDVRHLVLEIFFEKQRPIAQKFVQDLGPALSNVRRNLGTDADGVETLNKRVLVAFEDFDACIKELHSQMLEGREKMLGVLQYIDDPADPFRLQMPGYFAEAKELIEALVEQRDSLKKTYDELQSWFKLSGMKSSALNLLWDDLLIPEALVVGGPDKLKKEFLVPSFCNQRPVNLNQLMVLWGFAEPEVEQKAKAKKRGARRKSGVRKLQSVAAGSDAESAEEA